ncbi:ABC transporter permease [Streptococcus sp. zg-86]|uniref:ABC transporter permease n=1 Tax=Streptococcus zhangguiae TaxID=2664091 RepID=A0A6I4RG11_9STRE|nr:MULTISPECIES: ABC transporter permease [unclassified Streptococcus]MTB63815.1 ABC transporter permease [Streptococcus sp. zg-86]MTB90125.1 ABC transporter permease [Streptococcus sp. zg-36]MWV55797.1 ABC transporter permease [Streptococcus sp. zg-70]QTH47920.1 ABC transporter permease [Streptococcus sp. zg-86]
MLKAIQIEWLKSKRTKSLMTSMAIILSGIVWTVAVSRVDGQGVESFFDNQDTHALILPLAISIFVSRIVFNEKEGRTFKLQASNGNGLQTVFHDKLWFASLFFVLMAILYSMIIFLYIVAVRGASVAIQLVWIQIATLSLASFVQVCLYLTLALSMEKPGGVLALGFIGSFLGLIFQSQTNKLWSFLIPWDGASFLSVYKFGFDPKTDKGFYTVDSQLALKITIYTLYALACYLLARKMMLKKKGELL